MPQSNAEGWETVYTDYGRYISGSFRMVELLGVEPIHGTIGGYMVTFITFLTSYDTPTVTYIPSSVLNSVFSGLIRSLYTHR